ncbi:MAG TPA: hypothetical protein VJA22_00925 [Patescibacteria group bacterium]|nr:hypothetical protein [Patescibacteria group bacterium]
MNQQNDPRNLLRQKFEFEFTYKNMIVTVKGTYLDGHNQEGSKCHFCNASVEGITDPTPYAQMEVSSIMQTLDKGRPTPIALESLMGQVIIKIVKTLENVSICYACHDQDVYWSEEFLSDMQ